MKDNYIVVERGNLAELIKDVNILIEEGYVVSGGICCYTEEKTYYTQAMILKEIIKIGY